MQEIFKIWDDGGYTYSEAQEKLLQLKDGELIGDILNKCTICPIHNGTCSDYIELQTYGYNPDKGGKTDTIMICTLGVTGDGEKCPLNK